MRKALVILLAFFLLSFPLAQETGFASSQVNMKDAMHEFPFVLGMETDDMITCMIFTEEGKEYHLFLNETGACNIQFVFDWIFQKDGSVKVDGGNMGVIIVTCEGEDRYIGNADGQKILLKPMPLPVYFEMLSQKEALDTEKIFGKNYVNSELGSISFDEEGGIFIAPNESGDLADSYYISEGCYKPEWKGHIAFLNENNSYLYVYEDVLYLNIDGELCPFVKVEETLGGRLTDSIAWQFTNGVLTISGTGEMPDFGELDLSDAKATEECAPWYLYGNIIEEIIVEEGIASVGNNAFAYTGAVSITLPSTLRRLGDNAIYGAQITGIELPDGLESIGHFCFGYNPITEIEIPDSVIELGYAAFFGCGPLKTVKLSKNLKVIESSTFTWCNVLEEITLPASVEKVERAAFYDCFFLKNVYYNNEDCVFEEGAILDCKNAKASYQKPSIISFFGN